MSKSISLFFFCFLSIAVPSSAYATTHITSETSFGESVSWTKEGSPYILDNDIFMSDVKNVYIGPGVTVQSGPDDTHYLFMLPWNVHIDGTLAEPVVIKGLSTFTISGATSTISHAVINVGEEFSLFGGHTTINSSIISGSNMGIDAHQTSISIRDSVIEGNRYGIYSFYTPIGPVLGVNCFIDSPEQACGQNMGGEGNAAGDDPLQNHISIHNSVIASNTVAAIINATSNTISAENNWWGTARGPGVGSVQGAVDVAPWLTKDPRLPVDDVTCCSNVIFLPGIEGSRLYRDEKSTPGSIFATSTNQLWEPNRNADVKKLFLDSSGKSLDPTVYTKDIIDSTFGFSIYKKFITMMNGVVADGTINKWQAFPYDWRMSVDSLITPALMSAIQSSASSSKTGKVTLVAHSTGGLVAKMLYKKLQDKGLGGLVDKVIFVAVPELGTPQAMTSLLHGDGQSLGGGLLMSKSTARQFGQNMLGAYGLLPSKAYFSTLLDPIVSFAKTSLAGVNFSSYSAMKTQPQSASAYNAFEAFLAGLFDRRSNPAVADLQSPIRLRTAMIDTAQKIHDVIDSLVFPSSTKAISFIGWGKKTTKGVVYSEKDKDSLAYTATTTLLGDGTVVVDSAAGTDSDQYYVDLKNQSIEHSTILNGDATLGFLKGEITTNSTQNDDQLLKIPGISKKRPTLDDVSSDTMTFRIHSPVELAVYDSQGRHSGTIPNPDPTSDLVRYELNIPGSEIHTDYNEDPYITVPYGDTYKIVLTGTDIGTFTLDTEHEVNLALVATSTFADLPVTPLLRAELDLAPTTATSSQLLKMDTDGDGVVDATSSPSTHGRASDDQNEKNRMKNYCAALRRIIAGLHLQPAKEKAALAKIDRLDDLLKKGKKLKINENGKSALGHFHDQHWIVKKMDETKKQSVAAYADEVIDSISEDK